MSQQAKIQGGSWRIHHLVAIAPDEPRLLVLDPVTPDSEPDPDEAKELEEWFRNSAAAFCHEALAESFIRFVEGSAPAHQEPLGGLTIGPARKMRGGIEISVPNPLSGETWKIAWISDRWANEAEAFMATLGPEDMRPILLSYVRYLAWLRDCSRRQLAGMPYGEELLAFFHKAVELAGKRSIDKEEFSRAALVAAEAVDDELWLREATTEFNASGLGTAPQEWDWPPGMPE